MRRIGLLLVTALVGLWIAGCGGGLEEGPPKEGPTDSVTPDFKAEMMKNAEKMKMKGKPAAAPATPTPAAK
jgi:hypothetical protein